MIEAVRYEGGQDGTPQKKMGLIAGQWVPLTAAGVPRKKPGRKPGAGAKAKGEGSDPPEAKARKPRKPRDPNAPPVQRKRKIAPVADGAENMGPSSKVFAMGPNEHASSPQQTSSSPHVPPSSSQPVYQQQTLDHRYSPNIPKREGFSNSMSSILNSDEPPPRPQSTSNTTSMPVRSSGQSYDPIRGGYDPVREIFGNAGSPRAPSQSANRSPSIASLVDPSNSVNRSPGQPHSGYQPPQPRFHEPSLPGSPHAPRVTSTPTAPSEPVHHPSEVKEQAEVAPPQPKPVVRESQFTTIANGPIKKVSPKQKPITAGSTPRTDNLDDMQENDGRSILDFGRAKPGEETQTPTIVLNIPIKPGETNRYVNFMRLAEDRYGWDALHPRLAANRDRKARIAAATASLEKVESGRESGDDMSVDLSDNEASQPENGVASGPDAQAKPVKKKRNFKEDNYDVDDDFVDDSELLWEAQAAASRDGFFVYSGPLVPEVEKPARYVHSPSLVCLPHANLLAGKNFPNAAVEAEVVVAVVVARPEAGLARAVAEALALVAARSPASLASPSQRRLSVSVRRLSARRWRRLTRHPHPDMRFSILPRRHLSLSLSSVLRVARA